jgi:hypothetical protein
MECLIDQSLSFYASGSSLTCGATPEVRPATSRTTRKDVQVHPGDDLFQAHLPHSNHNRLIPTLTSLTAIASSDLDHSKPNCKRDSMPI